MCISVIFVGKEIQEGTSRSQKLWSQQETLWLAKCYCDASEDPIRGNSQKRASFWGTVKEKFNENEYGWERLEDSLSSKWRDVNKLCSEFLPIFKDVKDRWRSGANDDDVYATALSSYQTQYLKEFKLKDAFFFLKEHPKWNAPNDVVRRTQDDSPNIGDNMGDAFNLSQDVDFENELFGGMPTQRPIGRDRAKKAARSEASSDAAASSRGRSSGSSKMDDFMDSMGKYKDVMTSKKALAIDRFNEYVSIQTAISGYDLFKKDDQELANPGDRRRFSKLRGLIRRKMKDDLNIDDAEGSDEEFDEGNDDDNVD